MRSLALALLVLASGAAADEDFADYPAVIREDVARVKGIPTLETLRGVTVLHVGGVPIMWKWADAGEEKSLGDVVKLEPDTEYAFDVLTLDDCARVTVDYPFRVDGILVLRILKGDQVVFDAGLKAKRREPENKAPAASASASSHTEIGRLSGELLDCRTRCDRNAADGWGALSRSRKLPSGAPLVMVQQPMREPAVVVLVYDADAGEGSVDVTVFEAACPEEYFPGHRATLQRVDQDAPIFVGRVDVEGAHGTLVKVQYDRGAQRYESETVGMAFH
jgi:hypothetical protein